MSFNFVFFYLFIFYRPIHFIPSTTVTKIFCGTTLFRELITAKVWRTASGCPPCTASAVYKSSSRAKTEKVMNTVKCHVSRCFVSRHHFISCIRLLGICFQLNVDIILIFSVQLVFFSGRQIGEDQRRGERDRERRECHQRGRPLYRPHPHRHRLLARSQPKEQQQVLGDSLAFCLLRYFLRLVYVYPLIPQIHYTVYITRLLYTLFRPPFGNTKNPPVKIRKIQKTVRIRIYSP